MITRNKLIAFGPIAILTIMGTTMTVSNRGYANDLIQIDFNGIDSVVVEGSDSRLDFTTLKGGAPVLRMTKDGWGDMFCDAKVNFERAGSTLHIRLSQSGLRTMLPGQCNTTLAVDLPENLNLAVLQPSTVTNIKGLMKDVSIKGDKAVVTIDGGANDLKVDCDKAVVTFSGSVRNVSINADQAVAELTLNHTVSQESIHINAKKLVTNIGLPADTVLEYSVIAPLAVFSNPFKTTPGAALKVDIRSQMLQGSIYSVAKVTPG